MSKTPSEPGPRAATASSARRRRGDRKPTASLITSARERAREAILEAIERTHSEVLTSIRERLTPGWQAIAPTPGDAADAPVHILISDLPLLIGTDPGAAIEGALASVILPESLVDPLALVLAIKRGSDAVSRRLFLAANYASPHANFDTLYLAAVASAAESGGQRLMDALRGGGPTDALTARLLTATILQDDALYRLAGDESTTITMSAELRLALGTNGFVALRDPDRRSLEHARLNRAALERTYPGLITRAGDLAPELRPQARFLCDVVEWAAQWNIADRWMLERVVAAAEDWSYNRTSSRHWPGAAVSPRQEETRLPPYFAFRWETAWGGRTEEPWESYERRAVARFKEWLATHRTTVERGGRAESGAAAFEPRKLEQHARWLVDWHFASSGYRATSTVREAVKQLAQLAGWTLTPTKRGRRGYRKFAEK